MNNQFSSEKSISDTSGSTVRSRIDFPFPVKEVLFTLFSVIADPYVWFGSLVAAFLLFLRIMFLLKDFEVLL